MDKMSRIIMAGKQTICSPRILAGKKNSPEEQSVQYIHFMSND